MGGEGREARNNKRRLTFARSGAGGVLASKTKKDRGVSRPRRR